MDPRKKIFEHILLHNNLKHQTITRPGFHLGAPKSRKVVTQLMRYERWGNPLPESCVGLYITLCTERIREKHIKTTMFAQQSKQIRKLHSPASIWEHQTHIQL